MAAVEQLERGGLLNQMHREDGIPSHSTRRRSEVEVDCAAKLAQPTSTAAEAFGSAYHQDQEKILHLYQKQSADPNRASWLNRVSHRASRISNRPLANTIPGAATSASNTAPLTSDRYLALPLRAGSSQDNNSSAFNIPRKQVNLPQKRASLPTSPASPTIIGATPIDDSFGERLERPVEHQRARRATLTAPLDNMDKYSRQAGDNAYDSDAEADDEFERSVFTSPIIAAHFADDGSDHPSESEDDNSVMDGEDTPTTQGWADREGRSPTGKITQWSEEETADYIAALSPALKQYGQRLIEEGVNGEALIALNHEDLKELGITSVGHRLTILKAVYEQKMRAGIKIEDGDYVPLSVEGEKGDQHATQDDISRLIESLRLRDQRMLQTEAELRTLKQDLDRVVDENRKLREETLPIMRKMKDEWAPLPDPSGGTIPSPRGVEAPRAMEVQQGKGSSLSRKFSTKKLFLKGDTSKQPSPTHPPQSHTPQPREVRDDGGEHLQASAAAMAASSHLTASMASQHSPISTSHGQQLSPTSPAYSTGPSHYSAATPHYSAVVPGGRSFPRDVNSSRYAHNGGEDGAGYAATSQYAIPVDQASARLQDRARRQAPTPSPREDEGSTRGADRDNPQVEIFKSFRVSIDDPCRVVLPVALKRYNITDDWRQYALYIVHGDQERCLGLEEKPLLLFKQLDKEGRKPMFMLRRHASPQEGWSGAAGSSAMAHHGHGGGHGEGGNAGGTKQIPGGVL
ncbi:unnamed protein product [Zymoseptoria tritici ST99CH_1A5]|uniref:SAM domain-containing protein n=1 Tax=Zymoseptoria tritici ST99CH_1A5 TaxID=1276529 RepID=A0A1Y6LB79_ZYMTR|nr:unnamed protein product [Zymoseptoria tritici ST99CH_1A5]